MSISAARTKSKGRQWFLFLLNLVEVNGIASMSRCLCSNNGLDRDALCRNKEISIQTTTVQIIRAKALHKIRGIRIEETEKRWETNF